MGCGQTKAITHSKKDYTTTAPVSTKILEINHEWRVFEDHPLGEGCFGKVYKGQNKNTGEVVAVKSIRLDSLDRPGGLFDEQRLRREISLMQQVAQFKNENIVKFYGHAEKD